MPKIFMSEPARIALAHLLDNGLDRSSAIVISPEPRTDTLLARFVPKHLTGILKTHFIGDIYPGIPVYTFGMEPLQDVTIELSLIPMNAPSLANGKFTHHPDQFLFRVFVEPLEARQRPVLYEEAV